MNYIKTFDPHLLLGDRLELTLYRMFVEAYLEGKYKNEAEMYKRFISYFPKEVGIHTPDNFINLIEEIKTNQFDHHYPIYANPEEFALLNGSHRCAISIQIGIKDIPYCLRFYDDRVDDSFFHEVFGNKEFKHLEDKREEYISNCDPLISLKCRLRHHMRRNQQSFQDPFSSQTIIPSLRTYQSFEKLGISGKRSSQKRISIYELPRYFNKSMNILEIGCNVGFLSLSMSGYVHSIDAFDIDPSYIMIAKMVEDFCDIRNCHFTVNSVTGFNPTTQYDFILSTAVHGWFGMPFDMYISSIAEWMKSNGLLLFESHELDVKNNWTEQRKALVSNFDLLDSGIIDDVDERMYESEIREFLVLRKRPDVDYGNFSSLSAISVQEAVFHQSKHVKRWCRRSIIQSMKDQVWSKGELFSGLLCLCRFVRALIQGLWRKVN